MVALTGIAICIVNIMYYSIYFTVILVKERVKAVIKNYSVKHEFSCSALKLDEC